MLSRARPPSSPHVTQVELKQKEDEISQVKAEVARVNKLREQSLKKIKQLEESKAEVRVAGCTCVCVCVCVCVYMCVCVHVAGCPLGLSACMQAHAGTS